MKEDKKLDLILEAEFSSDMLDLKSKLKKIVEEKNAEQKPKILRILLPIAAIAASLILVIVFLPNLLGTTNGDLYSTYYEPYPMALNQRGDNQEALNEAIASYSSKDYELASKSFMSLFEETEDAVYLLYYGSSEQAMGRYEEAIKIYDDIISIGDQRVVEQAQWYKILALIKVEKEAEAKKLINAISPDHYKFEEVQKLK